MNIPISKLPDNVELIHLILPISIILFILYVLFRIQIISLIKKTFKKTQKILYIEGLNDISSESDSPEEHILLNIKNFFDTMTNTLIIYNNKCKLNKLKTKKRL